MNPCQRSVDQSVAGTDHDIAASRLLKVLGANSQRFLKSDLTRCPQIQFDARCEPLPVIEDILKCYGGYIDTWSAAIWFRALGRWNAKELADGTFDVL